MAEKPIRKPSYAPLYCALYPEFAEMFRKHGYALAIHGSLQRDFDLIGIPWAESASVPEVVIEEVAKEFDVKVIEPGTPHLHGRLVWTIAISFGSCFIDLSFMPLVKPLLIKPGLPESVMASEPTCPRCGLMYEMFDPPDFLVQQCQRIDCDCGWRFEAKRSNQIISSPVEVRS